MDVCPRCDGPLPRANAAGKPGTTGEFEIDAAPAKDQETLVGAGFPQDDAADMA